MEIRKARNGRLGVEIFGFDPKNVTSGDAEAIRSSVYRHRLAVFHGVVDMSDETYLAMARVFGRPQIYFQSNYHHTKHPEIFVSSNVLENGKKVGVSGTGRFWHSDYQFFDEPLSLTFVYPKIIPKSKRETMFIDMGRVLEELPKDLLSSLDRADAFHEAVWYYKIQARDIDRPIADLVKEFRQISPGARHPAIITHPVTGERFLYVSRGFTQKIVGMSHEENETFLPRLFDFIEQERFVHAQEWATGELLLWDNRSLIHMASSIPNGEPSKSYRIGVYDDLPFYVC